MLKERIEQDKIHEKKEIAKRRRQNKNARKARRENRKRNK